MNAPEILAEIRQWMLALQLSKFEVFACFVTALIFWRLPLILKHRSEIRAIDQEFQRKTKELELRIAKEESRRIKRRKGS